jgi:hypothetical protein
MKKLVIIIWLILCGTVLASYNSADVNIVYGWLGSETTASALTSTYNTSATRTYIELQKPLRLPPEGGSISKIRYVISSTAAFASGEVCAYHVIGDNLTYVAGSVRTLTGTGTALGSGVLCEIDLTANPITDVCDGDVLAFRYTAASAFAPRGNGANGINGYVIYYNSDILEADNIISGAEGGVDGNTIPLSFEVTVVDNTFVAEDFNVADTNFDSGKRYWIPNYPINTGQYIILEDVCVPDGNTLTIITEYMGTLNLTNDKKVTMTPGGSIAMTLDNNSVQTSGGKDCNYALPLKSGANPDRYDIYIYWEQSYWNCYFVNKDNGSSFGGGTSASSKDIRLISLTEGEMPARSAFYYSSIKIVSDSNQARIGRIVSTRWPLLVVGDSIAALDYVGGYLESAFSQPRYAILTGIGGTYIGRSTYSLKSIQERFTAGANKIRKAVVVLVNGPGLNDIDSITDDADLMASIPYQIAGCVTTIAGQATTVGDYTGGSKDVVLCNMIPFPSGTASEQAAIVKTNSLIRNVAAGLAGAGRPVNFVNVYGYSGDYIRGHPDAAGSEWYAGKIAEAYEGNIKASSISNLNRTSR